jgi:hypothetical protein
MGNKSSQQTIWACDTCTRYNLGLSELIALEGELGLN